MMSEQCNNSLKINKQVQAAKAHLQNLMRKVIAEYRVSMFGIKNVFRTSLILPDSKNIKKKISGSTITLQGSWIADV